MSILQVAYPFAPVGFDATGGAEQVAAMLDHALRQLGHRTMLLACEGSQAEGELVTGPAIPDSLDDAACRSVRETYARLLREFAAARNPDVIHMHGVDFIDYLPEPGPPVLATLHLPYPYYDGRTFALTRPRTYLNCVSFAQQTEWPPGSAPPCVIANGVRLEDYSFRHQKGDFVLALGRVCPEKGFHLALEAARVAGCRLLLAGKVFPYPSHQQYFQEHIVPRLDELRRFIGPVDLPRKRVLLAAARCLLVTSLVDETSSLVAMEALASGTPVVAFRAGALAEIVADGRTGFLVSSLPEAVEALRSVHTIDPEICRQIAWRRFSSHRMTASYIELYAQIRARTRFGGSP